MRREIVQAGTQTLWVHPRRRAAAAAGRVRQGPRGPTSHSPATWRSTPCASTSSATTTATSTGCRRRGRQLMVRHYVDNRRMPGRRAARRRARRRYARPTTSSSSRCRSPRRWRCRHWPTGSHVTLTCGAPGGRRGLTRRAARRLLPAGHRRVKSRWSPRQPAPAAGTASPARCTPSRAAGGPRRGAPRPHRVPPAERPRGAPRRPGRPRRPDVLARRPPRRRHLARPAAAARGRGDAVTPVPSRARRPPGTCSPS